jgi:hypothetical protein
MPVTLGFSKSLTFADVLEKYIRDNKTSKNNLFILYLFNIVFMIDV